MYSNSLKVLYNCRRKKKKGRTPVRDRKWQHRREAVKLKKKKNLHYKTGAFIIKKQTNLLAPFAYLMVWDCVFLKVINFPLSFRALSYADIQNKMPTISIYASLPPVALSSWFDSLPATPIRPLKKLP